jgi:ferredoxin
MSKYAIVNKKTCIGCGTCGEFAPDVFGFDDNGLAEILFDNNQGIKKITGALLDDLIDAYEECPTESIKLSDNPMNTVI